MGLVQGLLSQLSSIASTSMWGAILTIVAGIVSVVVYLLFKRWKKQEDLEKAKVEQDKQHADTVQEISKDAPKQNESIKAQSDALSKWEKP